MPHQLHRSIFLPCNLIPFIRMREEFIQSRAMEKSLHSYLFIALLFVFYVISFSLLSLTKASTVGFSAELIHRDSPKSRFYDSSLTSFRRFQTASPLASSKVFSDGIEYLMNISVGTPPFSTAAIVDTGSDLIWTQCAPCLDCYEQKPPLFNPGSSSTYGVTLCQSKLCRSAKGTSCHSGLCEYAASYEDGSYSRGILGTDKITLSTTTGHPVSFPGIIFGCGYKNRGTFTGDGSGIIGLGAGTFSLISQLNSSFGGRFSYCLAPRDSHGSSIIHFGDHAVVSGNGVVSTSITVLSPSNYYFMPLRSFTVRPTRQRLGENSSLPEDFQFHWNGNMAIDSGTTLTFLPTRVYRRLEYSVSAAIGLKRVADPLKFFNLCYRDRKEFPYPNITFHLDGADLELGQTNSFLRRSRDVVCFAFAPSKINMGILGNMAHTNFLVGYDLIEKTVSFKPTDCEQHRLSFDV
ncbi:Nepenthesin [Bertholletia excelsa]